MKKYQKTLGVLSVLAVALGFSILQSPIALALEKTNSFTREGVSDKAAIITAMLFIATFITIALIALGCRIRDSHK